MIKIKKNQIVTKLAQILTKLDTQIVTKLKNSYCEKLNSNCEKTQKLELWPNLKKITCDTTQQLQLWQNSKSEIVTLLKKCNCDKTKKKIVTVWTVVIGTSFSKKKTWHLAILAMFFVFVKNRLVGKKYYFCEKVLWLKERLV